MDKVSAGAKEKPSNTKKECENPLKPILTAKRKTCDDFDDLVSEVSNPRKIAKLLANGSYGLDTKSIGGSLYCYFAFISRSSVVLLTAVTCYTGSILRPRIAKVAEGVREEPPKNKKVSKAVSRSRQFTKPKPCDSIEKGDVVLCKMRGYCEWPGIVTGFERNLVVIRFFGDDTIHKAAIDNFYRFEQSYELIAFNLRMRKTPLYSKSIREAEESLGIPSQQSIFNQFL